jgi:hypothetical protein
LFGSWFTGGDNVSQFNYSLYFYFDNLDASAALEFDANQTLGGQRSIWGSD